VVVDSSWRQWQGCKMVRDHTDSSCCHGSKVLDYRDSSYRPVVVGRKKARHHRVVVDSSCCRCKRVRDHTDSSCCPLKSGCKRVRHHKDSSWWPGRFRSKTEWDHRDSSWRQVLPRNTVRDHRLVWDSTGQWQGCTKVLDHRDSSCRHYSWVRDHTLVWDSSWCQHKKDSHHRDSSCCQ